MIYLIGWFSMGLILYVLSCIKHRRLQGLEFPRALYTFLFAPIMLLILIWDNL